MIRFFFGAARVSEDWTLILFEQAGVKCQKKRILFSRGTKLPMSLKTKDRRGEIRETKLPFARLSRVLEVGSADPRSFSRSAAFSRVGLLSGSGPKGAFFYAGVR